jgi:adenine phosphoribosyltransferase
MTMGEIERLIRDVPDFPKPGIVFKDITPVLREAAALGAVVETLRERAAALEPDLVLGIESRGFLLAAPLAVALGRGLVIARKPGKLPWQTVSEAYGLEYGSDRIEMHVDAVHPGQRVLVVDDVLATGGTAQAAGRLVSRQGGTVAGYLFLVELAFLAGRARLGATPAQALLRY